MNLSVQAVRIIAQIREDLCQTCAAGKRLLIIGDGGYCNRNVFGGVQPVPNTDLLVRSRKDAVLCMPAPPNTGRVYAKDTFTPQSVRTDDSRPWHTADVDYGGQRRQIQFKRIDGVLWQGGAKRRTLTLFVIRPIAYKTTKTGKTYYRDPAYLLTTATQIDSQQAIQMYLDRWQIEVNHREEKHDLGIGQAQVHAQDSVGRLPSFLVAAYAIMQLAALDCHGPTRTQDYLPRPRWHSKDRGPSCRDIAQLLRRQVLDERQEHHRPDLTPRPISLPQTIHQCAPCAILAVA
jgi:hypothetical protein